MKIMAYQIFVQNWKSSEKNTNWLYDELRKLSVFTDSNNWDYGIMEVGKEDNFIYGYIAQESNEELIKYNKDKEVEEIPEYKWEKTFFIIDSSDGKFFIHKRKYSPTNLNHQKTMTRLEEIFGKIFNKNYYTPVEFFPFRKGITPPEFRDIFYSNHILEVKFKNIYGHYVSPEADLHNPRKEWDRYRAESHNRYDAKIIRTAYLEANKSKNLSKSPTARTFLESGAKGDKIKFVNSHGDVIVEQSESVATLELKLENRPYDYSIEDLFKQVIDFIKRKSNEISKYRLFESLTQYLDFEDRDYEKLQEEVEKHNEKD